MKQIAFDRAYRNANRLDGLIERFLVSFVLAFVAQSTATFHVTIDSIFQINDVMKSYIYKIYIIYSRDQRVMTINELNRWVKDTHTHTQQ